jgi:hypothetical protein
VADQVVHGATPFGAELEEIILGIPHQQTLALKERNGKQLYAAWSGLIPVLHGKQQFTNAKFQFAYYCNRPSAAHSG